MVTLGLRPKVEDNQCILEDEVHRQALEIVKASQAGDPQVLREERPSELTTAAWTYSVPFAGVRYYRFHA